MAGPIEQRAVDPAELQRIAELIDGHAGDFQTSQHRAYSRASQVSLGAGQAATALHVMLTAWESNDAAFARSLAEHAQGHREAAYRYGTADTEAAGAIDNIAFEL